MNCLLITNVPEQADPEIISYLQRHQVDYETAADQMIAIQKAHQSVYDVVVLHAENCPQVDRAIRILKDCNPQVRIIVRAGHNSRDLETAVRKENIFYYHVDSFGPQEITAALGYALGLSKKRQDA